MELAPRHVQHIRDAKPMVKLDERFWSKVQKTESCWVWIAGHTTAGYGGYWLNGKIHRAHRLAFLDAGGIIPDGKVIDHLCRNRGCVNPEHLEAVTNKVNHERGSRAQQTECKWGHPYTSENTFRNKRNGTRSCRICRNLAVERCKARKK